MPELIAVEPSLRTRDSHVHIPIYNPLMPGAALHHWDRRLGRHLGYQIGDYTGRYHLHPGLGYRPNTRSKGDEPTSGISRKTVGDVFTNLKHSNNHHLCSLWMWLVGQNASALVYRLPSVLASIGTIVLAGVDRFTPIPACGMHRGDSHVMVVLG